jgi:hypothetical protein
MTTSQLAQVGGVFAVLVFWHFFADWVFQSHKEAMAKAKNHLVRARHCVVYTVLFIPLLLLLSVREGQDVLGGTGTASLEITSSFYISLAILFFSHFVIDTYIPVMLWAKYLRRAPQFADVVPPVVLTKEQVEGLLRGEGKIKGRGWSDYEVDRITYKSDEEAFKAFFMTPVGAILCITMDQFLHIAFLLPVAWLMIQ